MNRHVIKGRGKNRGKYLCYPRMAGLPPGGEYVWLAEQSKAARHKDPYSTGLARKHDGYFVKLVAPNAIRERVKDLRAFIRDHAAGADAKRSCHWIHGSNETEIRDAIDEIDRKGWCGDFDGEGANFCGECVDEVIDALRAVLRAKRPASAMPDEDADVDDDDCGIICDGGWDTDHDSTPFCAKCGAKLSGNLTEYGADEEIRALTTDCAPTFGDVDGWECLDDALVNVSNDDPRWRRIARVVDAAAAEEQKHADSLAALAASSGMPEARGTFVSLLAARAEQKAPEPSFALWTELLAWFPARRPETPESTATEKRLFKEAVRFLGFCGIRAYMTNGGMGMAEAPHGTYYWPFVVMHEQFKLWKDVDFEAGRAVGLRCLASKDAPGRDANPFEKEEGNRLRAEAWDAGFLQGLHEAAPGDDDDAEAA